MENRMYALVVVVAAAGLLSGFAASSASSDKDRLSYCEKVEEGVRKNQSLNGSIACFEPGLVDVDVSDRVKNNSELKCVCRHSLNGQARLFPIGISD
ncbi:MAG: hypothetical protein ABEJ93_04775 [Candidatus Nanohalobium sp.]